MGVPVISSLTRNTQSWHPGPFLRGRDEKVTTPPVLSTVRPPQNCMSVRTLMTCSNVNYFCIIHNDWVCWLRIVMRQHKAYRLGSKSTCFPGGSVVKKKKSACQCREGKKCECDPYAGKILLEQQRKTHSNILAWKIPWTEDPGGL